LALPALVLIPAARRWVDAVEEETGPG